MTTAEHSEGPQSGPFNNGFGRHSYRGSNGFGWASAPGINPPKVLAVIAGFLIFPPLGVAALGYFWWNSRRTAWDGQGPAFAEGRGRGCGTGHRMGRRSGNTAFDAHSEKVMADLAAERQAFHEHRAELRRKQDQEAFDGFQASRDPK